MRGKSSVFRHYANVLVVVGISCGCSDSGTSSPQDVKSTLFYMSAEKSGDYDDCGINIIVVNSSTKTLETFAGDVTAQDKSGATLYTGHYVLQYVDAGKAGSDTFHMDSYYCMQLASVRLRSVSDCKVDGKYYKDCANHVGVLSGADNLLRLN